MSSNDSNAVTSDRFSFNDHGSRMEPGSSDVQRHSNGSALQFTEKLSDSVVGSDNSNSKKVPAMGMARSVADSKLAPSADGTVTAVKPDVKELKLPSLQLAPRESRLAQPRLSQTSSLISKTTAPAKVVHIKPQQDIVSVINQLDHDGNNSAAHSKADSNGDQELMWGQNIASLALLDEDYDSDSDSTASVESQQSTIRRQLPECDNRLLQHADGRGNTEANRPDRDEAERKRNAKKVPPPPPVRKASALSSSMNATLSHDSANAQDRDKRQETEIY